MSSSGSSFWESIKNNVPIAGTHFCESCRRYYATASDLNYHNLFVHRPRRIINNMDRRYEDDVRDRKESVISQEPGQPQPASPRKVKKTPSAPLRTILYPPSPSSPGHNSSTALLRCKDCPFRLFTTDAAYQSHRQHYHGCEDEESDGILKK